MLLAFFKQHGQSTAVPLMRQGDELKVRLANWNSLSPLLSTFGIDFSSDAKTLVVAGDNSELYALLYILSKRLGNSIGEAVAGEVLAASAEEKVGDASEWKTTAFQGT